MWSPLPHQRRSTTRIPAKLVRFDLSSFFLFLVLCMIFFFKKKKHIYVEVKKKKMPRLNVELAQSGQSNAFGEMTVVDVVFKRLEGTLCAIVL